MGQLFKNLSRNENFVVKGLLIAALLVLAASISSTVYSQIQGYVGYGYGYNAWGYGYGYGSSLPSAVSDLALSTTTSSGELRASWTAVTTCMDETSLDNFAYYKVYWATSSTDANSTSRLSAIVATQGSGTINATISGLTAGTTYYMAIYTVDSMGNWSNISNVSSLAAGATSTAGQNGGGGGGGSSTTTSPTTGESVPVVVVAPTPALGVVTGFTTPTVTGVKSESLRTGNFAYGYARVASLAVEQGLAKYLATNLENKFGRATFNSLFRKATKTSGQWWYAYVNAYTYGGYTLKEVQQGVKFGGKTVHPTIPASAWRNSADYKAYINK
ncbi:MAG: fibronectin type III domain-containing protein [Patescibacteria group bacterium]|jgi:hypothetical protein